MKVALVGNQNSGKTSLFNVLTGTNQKIGNWPGVTIERKEGKIKGTDITLVDLPGIYSLSPYTAEEEVSRKFVVEEKPDLIINIVDATSIERSLYLTTQLLELDTNVVVTLNMTDLLEKKNLKIDEDKLSKLLNTTIIKISALKNEGIDKLIDTVKNKTYLENRHQCIFSNDVEELIKEIKTNKNVSRFEAVKLIEKDALYKELIDEATLNKINQLEEKVGYDTEQIIANERYEFIVNIKKDFVTQGEKKVSTTDKLDKVFLNKWAAIPIFACIMFLIYYLSVGVIGSWTVDAVGTIMDIITEATSGLLESWNASSWTISLVCDGIIGGVGAVLSFVPQLIILFICLAILETTGYMSRIVFVLDRLFRKFGLNGKSLIPFIVGAGCSVPGIMASRTIENEDEKRITIMCTPFIPCGAKLPIIAVFAGAFFEKYAGIVTASLYFLAVVVILVSAVIMKKFFFKGNASAFISELPEYKAPSIKYVGRDVFDKTIAYFKRAGSVILICSIVVWALLSFSFKAEYIETKYTHTIDSDILVELAKGQDIDFTEEAIEKGEILAVVSFDKNGQLMVSYGVLNEEETYDYTDKVIVPLVTETYLQQTIGAKTDKRTKLVVSTEGTNIVYGYSLTVDNSILAGVGKCFSWIFYPVLGELNWGATVSAVQGLVAKEQVVSSMAIIAGMDGSVDSGNLIFGSTTFAGFTGLTAYAFMVFNLFSAPCFGAIGAMRRELGSKKKMFIAVAFQTGLAWALASLIGVWSLFF